MIYPIRAYGDPVLKKKCRDIPEDYMELNKLIDDMYETMYASNGVGLAAPQIGKDIRLFVIDTQNFSENKQKGVKKTFINARILDESGIEWDFEEGCLSIPTVREAVKRKPDLRIRYQDENFKWHEEGYSEIEARVIQHEYDHIEGILFTDHLSAFKKQLLKGKLNNISKGKVEIDYKMKFYNQ
ncbi:MAG: peptide deformylase [Flavobacteriales bacterium]|nr:peptide deformylase [Flavobacteriales bacterium]